MLIICCPCNERQNSVCEMNNWSTAACLMFGGTVLDNSSRLELQQISIYKSRSVFIDPCTSLTKLSIFGKKKMIFSLFCLNDVLSVVSHDV